MSEPQPLRLVPRRKAAEECGVTIRTAKRREAAKLFGFDQPIVVGRRVYYDRDRFEAAKRLGFVTPKAAAE
jgi:hypothetical protein